MTNLREAGRSRALAIAVLLVALGGIGCGSDSGSDSGVESGSRSSPPGGEELLERLRAGGMTIVFRHAATDPSEEDDRQVDLDDCSTQRNLTDEGRADARSIGEAFRELRIPVGAIWASPYCRARDTAELAFGGAEVVDGLERLYPELDERADRHLNGLIREQAPAPGDPNLVIAAHGVYPSALEPAVTLDEGEAAVYAVGDEDVALLGRVAPDEWVGLGPPGGSASAAEPSGVVERVQPSVVSVQVREGEHAGTGFRVAVDGIVVTNAHIVGDAEEVSVALGDGSRRPARVLGRAPGVDIAALELANDSGIPPMHSGSGLAEAEVGDTVLAIGSPVGPAGTSSSGTVDALNTPVRLGGGAEVEALATDAVVDRANSGGPLVNADGEVLGVSTAIATPGDDGRSGRVGFAIPVDVARSAALEIVEEGG